MPSEHGAMQSNQNMSALKSLVKEGFEPATAWLHVFAAELAIGYSTCTRSN
jgi:hypothetical protein